MSMTSFPMHRMASRSEGHGTRQCPGSRRESLAPAVFSRAPSENVFTLMALSRAEPPSAFAPHHVPGWIPPR